MDSLVFENLGSSAIFSINVSDTGVNMALSEQKEKDLLI